MRLGVLGGTFDPLHIGHLIIAEEARLQLSLDKVLFVPAGQPYLRSSQPAASALHRLAMVRLGIEDNPFFEASSLEIDRPGPTYTVDTLRELRSQAGNDTQLFFILGQDSLRDLLRWHRPEELLALCTVVAAPRPGVPPVSPQNASALLPGTRARVKVLRSPLIGISGTELRRRAAQGASLRYWVPPAVEGYIREHGLYKGLA